jgi:glycosyltransferase involved in cell wall biosynthesis
MRVLMLAQSYAPVVGGVERVVEDLSVELARRGHEVAVATLRQPGDEPPPARDGVRVHAVGSAVHRVPATGIDAERRHAPPLPDPETALGLRRVLRRERPDVVHAHNWLLNSYLPLDRRSGPALALSMHDYGLVCATKRFLNRGADCTGPRTGKCMRCAGDYYGRLRGFGIAAGTRIADPWVRRHVDVFLPVSAAVRDRCGLGPGDLHRVVPNFVGELAPPPPDADERLAALPDEPFVLFFGDVTVDKGGGQLVEAYRALDDPPPLVLVGRCYLDEMARAPGVVALGPMPHRLAIEALRRSLFAVAPSLLPETFGLVALEAAAVGKPIVASDIGGLAEVVVDGETGLLVAPGAREGLREAMRRLLDDAGLRSRMGEAGKLRAAQFGPDVVVPRFEEAYELALAARRGGRAAAVAG